MKAIVVTNQAAGTAAIATAAEGWFKTAKTLALDALDRAFDLGALDQPMPAIPTLSPDTAAQRVISEGAAENYAAVMNVDMAGFYHVT